MVYIPKNERGGAQNGTSLFTIFRTKFGEYFLGEKNTKFGELNFCGHRSTMDKNKFQLSLSVSRCGVQFISSRYKKKD